MSRFRSLPRAFYRRSARQVAPELLGRYLVREIEGERLVLRLVEVEAYLGEDDPASHAFRGPTRRNAAMFLDGGHAYVYFIYGMHFCMNVVCGREGVAHAVLLRAGEAVAGETRMRHERGLPAATRPRELAGGPARLCQALRIDRAFDGRSLLAGELRLTAGDPVDPGRVAAGDRVGVGYAGEAARWPLRYAVRGHPALSRPLG